MVFDSGSAQDAHALDRLQREMIGWLTTVTPAGQPQTFPVWYVWEDGEALLYSDPGARRNDNIVANPRVSLHLPDNGQGGDIVIVEGEARVDPATPPPTEHAGYLAKYGAWIAEFMGSPADLAAAYNVPIRVRPVRGVAFGS